VNDFPFEFSQRPGMEPSMVYSATGRQTEVRIPKSGLNETNLNGAYHGIRPQKQSEKVMSDTRENLLLNYKKEQIGGLDPINLYGVLDELEKVFEDAVTLKGNVAIAGLKRARSLIVQYGALYNLAPWAERYNPLVHSIFSHKEIKVPKDTGAQNGHETGKSLELIMEEPEVPQVESVPVQL